MNKTTVLFVALATLMLSCAPDSKHSTPEAQPRFNSAKAQSKTTVIMISVDGFRADYLQKYKPVNISRLAKEGVVAEGMKPSFPTNTFPNHISLVTGRVPGHHGIVSNYFYDKSRKEMYQMNDNNAVHDGSWYKGEPLWVTAEKSGMLAGTMFWVGSEATIGGVLSTYMEPYNDAVLNLDRSKKIIEWLKLPSDRRPHFITLYFSAVDSAGHKFGPDSQEVQDALKDVDQAIGNLVQYTDANKMDVQYVIVSDHGMQEVDATKTINIGAKADLSQFLSVERGAITLLYTENPAAIEPAYRELKKNEYNYKVYRAQDLPLAWGFDDADRRGDLIVVSEPGVYLYRLEGPPNQPPPRVSKATHGWDPETTTMRALFLARGSKFKSGLRIQPFQNIHVYPLILEVLDLKTNVPFDGNLSVLKPILK